jgi:hypothetical protein
MKIANRTSENVAQFKYLETAVRNQNLIREEIKRRLNFINACYHSVQNLFSSHLLSKNVKIKMCKIKCCLVLYGCETWSLILWEEHRQMAFDIWVLRRIFEPKRDKVTGSLEKTACSTNGEKGNAYVLLVGKPDGKMPLGRTRRRWVDIIKMSLRGIG